LGFFSCKVPLPFLPSHFLPSVPPTPQLSRDRTRTEGVEKTRSNKREKSTSLLLYFRFVSFVFCLSSCSADKKLMMISPSRKVKIPNISSTLFQEKADITALATVQKLISELLPSELTFAKESRDLLIDCCVEFIHLVSSEANEICERETKKTISADHVVKALVELGFEDYVQEIQEIAVEHKEQQKVGTPS
jgi:histone H3/H4